MIVCKPLETNSQDTPSKEQIDYEAVRFEQMKMRVDTRLNIQVIEKVADRLDSLREYREADKPEKDDKERMPKVFPKRNLLWR